MPAYLAKFALVPAIRNLVPGEIGIDFVADLDSRTLKSDQGQPLIQAGRKVLEILSAGGGEKADVGSELWHHSINALRDIGVGGVGSKGVP